MTLNILESLKEQHAQLKRLLDSPIWLSDTPKPSLDEMGSQIAQIKSLIQELEKLIQVSRARRDE